MPPSGEPPRRFQYRLRTLLILPIFVALSMAVFSYFDAPTLPCLLSLWAGFIGAILSCLSERGRISDVYYASLLGAIVGIILFLEREGYFIYTFLPKKWHLIRPENEAVSNDIRYIIILSLIFCPLLATAVAWFVVPKKSKPRA
jgi:hypothetical protein